jgi:hypothetical protein
MISHSGLSNGSSEYRAICGVLPATTCVMTTMSGPMYQKGTFKVSVCVYDDLNWASEAKRGDTYKESDHGVCIDIGSFGRLGYRR